MSKFTIRCLVISYMIVTGAVSFALILGAGTALDLPFRGPILALLILAICFALAMMWMWIGALLYVYPDAQKRGMNPWLWTLVAAFVPYLIGFVIYFVTRKPLPLPCLNCGQGTPLDAVHCPHCGHALKAKCAACGTVVEKDHRFCPSCGKAIQD
jgi:RNA polymerase subunit RPABC4/transcription elongation factor Spt4